jgi:hypothetical protein
LLVDQFEETFTLCDNEESRIAFIDSLVHPHRILDSPIIVVTTMRADYCGKASAYPQLAAAMSEHQFWVSPMTEEELRQSIEWPARDAGIQLEQGLVEELIKDVDMRNQPGRLPLLQHTLFELWHNRNGDLLTCSAYDSMGRIHGALEQRAELVYATLDDDEKQICRSVFLRLTQPGEGTTDTKRRAAFAELYLRDDEQHRQLVEGVLRRLSAADVRLVIVEGARSETGNLVSFVEVSHEALISHWKRLRDWVNADRSGLRVHRHLTESAWQWFERGGDPSYLYRGQRLKEAQEWADHNTGEVNDLEREFLVHSAEIAKSEEEKDSRVAELEARARFRDEMDSSSGVASGIKGFFGFGRKREGMLKGRIAELEEAVRQRNAWIDTITREQRDINQQREQALDEVARLGALVHGRTDESSQAKIMSTDDPNGATKLSNSREQVANQAEKTLKEGSLPKDTKERTQRIAQSKLSFAKSLLSKDVAEAQARLRNIVLVYENSDAAIEAAKLLNELQDSTGQKFS